MLRPIGDDVPALKRLLVTQAEQYGELVARIADFARVNGAPAVAEFARALASTYGCAPPAAPRRPAAIVPMRPVGPPFSVDELVDEIAAALRQAARPLAKADIVGQFGRPWQDHVWNAAIARLCYERRVTKERQGKVPAVYRWNGEPMEAAV